MKYLVAFDISNNRKRSRVVKECLACGFRAQKSVFEIFLDNSCLGAFEETMLKHINPDTDSVRIYPIDKTADESLRIIGKGKRFEKENCLVF